MAVQVGDILVSVVVEDAQTRFDALKFFPDATEQSLAAEFSWMLPELYDPSLKALKSVVQAYVFKSGGKNVLVDTCVGNEKPGRQKPEWTNANFPFIENLAAAGFEPEDIDVVLCTHMHLDHAGWNTRLENGIWVPTFRNAEYLSNDAELASLKARGAAGSLVNQLLYQDSVLPVVNSGQLRMVTTDHGVCGGVALEPSPGHTAGHVSVRISSGADTAIATGDMIHHPIQAVHPDWNSSHCELPDVARKTRRDFLERVADTRTRILPAHFAPCCAKREGAAFRFLLDS